MKGILKRPTQIKIKSFWGFFFLNLLRTEHLSRYLETRLSSNT